METKYDYTVAAYLHYHNQRHKHFSRESLHLLMSMFLYHNVLAILQSNIRFSLSLLNLQLYIQLYIYSTPGEFLCIVLLTYIVVNHCNVSYRCHHCRYL